MSLLLTQPECCRHALKQVPLKGHWKNNAVYNRVIFYDPAQLFENIHLKANPFKRNHTKRDFGFRDIFPPTSGRICACGCGSQLPKGHSRWASKECVSFAIMIWEIITGRMRTIRRCLYTYYGRKCIVCTAKNHIEIDHIIPVHRGGACCWLSNYRPICATCHKEKTLEDHSLRRKASLLSGS